MAPAAKRDKKPKSRASLLSSTKKKIDFRIYIHRVLKIVSPRAENATKMRAISTNAMNVLNDICVSILDNVCSEVKQMKQNTKTVTLNDNDIRSIFQLIFVGDLGKHAVSEAVKAILTYQKSGEAK